MMKGITWFVASFLFMFLMNYNFYPAVNAHGRVAVFIFEAGLFGLFYLVFDYSWLFVNSKLNKDDN